MDVIYQFYQAIFECFYFRLTISSLFSMFWFMLIIEVPRYFLLELFVAFYSGITYWKRKRKHSVARMLLYVDNPLITVLVPGKNEGKHIFKLVSSLREQTYQNLEVIIVDDGSDDDTPFICRDLEKDGYIDKYYRLNERGGKANAANYGVYHARVNILFIWMPTPHLIGMLSRRF